MNCHEVRELLGGDEAREITDKIDAAVEKHLKNCQSCRNFLELDQQLETIIREELQQVAVPERLRQKLQQNIKAESQNSKPAILWWSIAPVMAMAAMLLIFLLPQSGAFASMDEVAQLAIAEHNSHLDKPCIKKIPKDLASWSKEQIGQPITLPTIPLTGLELVGIDKCTLGDCPTAHLRYRHEGKIFSVFVFPAKEARFALVQDRNYTLDLNKHQVTIWEANQQVYAMVS